MNHVLQLAFVFLACAAPAARATEPQKAIDPDKIIWDRVNPDGTKFALLEGVRDKTGVPFSYAFFIPAGVWDAAHAHAATARVFVARGVLKLGYGSKINRVAATSFPAGSYLVVPANAPHFDGAGVDTIIIGTAIGPWSTEYVDARATPTAGSPSK